MISRRRLYRSIFLSGLFTVVNMAHYLAIQPLHAREVMQPVLGAINALCHVLQLPGMLASQMVGLWHYHHITTRGWVVSLVVNALAYVPAMYLLLVLWEKFGFKRSKISEVPAVSGEEVAGKIPSRRKVLTASVRGAFLAATGGFAYSAFYETNVIDVTRRQIPIRDLPPELEGLRLVHLTDIHHSPWVSRRHVRRIVELANSLRGDLVLLTGDYVSRSPAYIEPVIEELGKLESRIGTAATLGNHDWWESLALTRQSFAKTRIPLIDNTRLLVTPKRELQPFSTSEPDGLCVAGVGDLWEDIANYRAALGGVPSAIPRLLLSHNPDVAEEAEFVRGNYRVDLMLAGHTHGGQVRLPGLGALVTNSEYGQKYAHGLVQGPTCPVLISRGLGYTALPVRFNCRPEILVVELTRLAVSSS